MSIAAKALSQLMAIPGKSVPGWLELRDEAPALPTRFHVGEAAGAALAAGGAMAATLWEMRTGEQQEVAVGTRHAVGAGGVSANQGRPSCIPAQQLSAEYREAARLIGMYGRCPGCRRSRCFLECL